MQIKASLFTEWDHKHVHLSNKDRVVSSSSIVNQFFHNMFDVSDHEQQQQLAFAYNLLCFGDQMALIPAERQNERTFSSTLSLSITNIRWSL